MRTEYTAFEMTDHDHNTVGLIITGGSPESTTAMVARELGLYDHTFIAHVELEV